MQESLDFFKQAAKKKGVKYQQMIRVLLDHYARYFKETKN